MKQILVTIFALSFFILKAQDNVLVKKGNQAFITVEDFKNKFGYTLDHDKTQSKKEILDYYLTMKLKSDEARRLKLDTSPKFVNSMIEFLNNRKNFYLEQDPFYKEMEQQFMKRSQKEVQITQYFVEGINKDEALDYQSKLMRNEYFFDQMKNVKRVENRYYTAGELPYGLEEEIFSNLKKGNVLKMQESEGQKFIYTIIEDVRSYSGNYKLQWLLIKDSLKEGKQRIDRIYEQALKGSSFDKLVKEYSEDQKSKERPYVTFDGSMFDNEILNLLNSLKKNEISKPFKTAFGWNLVKLLEHDHTLDDIVTREKFKKSAEYIMTLKGYKVNYINEKFKPIEKKNSLIEDLKSERLVALFKKDSISRKDYEKQLIGIIGDEIEEQNIVEFNNGMTYTNWNFIADNSSIIKMIYKEQEQNIEEEIERLLPVSIAKSKIQVFDNLQHEINPNFKKEKELLEVNLLTELYDEYVHDEALSDKKGLSKTYRKLKSNYKWDERVEVIIAYCSSDYEKAKEVEKSLKENKTIKKLQQQYDKENVYFRRMKRELSSKDLPKEYSKEDKVKIYKEDEDYFVTKTIAVLPSQNPSYDELKPIVEKKYTEEYLNKKILKLREQVEVNQTVLNKL